MIINDIINDISEEHLSSQNSNRNKSHELHQFAALFSPKSMNHLLDYYFSLDNNECSVGRTLFYAIEYGWVDKSPLLTIDGRKESMEIGDALLTYSHHEYDDKGLFCKTITERALILQAKITRNKHRNPKVTINHDKSSRKEFELYSTWPKFSLNSSPEYYCLSSSMATKGVFPYAFYIAARKNYEKTTDWPCHWMGSPSRKNGKCNISLGRILTGLRLGNRKGGLQFGENLKANSDWEKLVRKLMKEISGKNTNPGWCGIKIPKSYKQKNFYMTQRFNKNIPVNTLNKALKFIPSPQNQYTFSDGKDFSIRKGKMLILNIHRATNNFFIDDDE